MKYELVPQDVVRAVCASLKESIKAVDGHGLPAVKLELERAYNTLLRNRWQCDVKPGDES